MEYVGIVRPTVAFHKQKAEKKNIPSRYITIYHILLISHLSLTVSTSVKCETIGRHPITFLAGLPQRKHFFPLLFYKSQPPIQY